MPGSGGHEPGHETLAATLETLDGARNYRDWIFGLARPHLEQPVLEVGAGTGTFTGLCADVGRVTAVEPVPSLADALRETHAGDRRVELVEGVIDDVAKEPHFASAVMFNVLEHIPDDGAALRGIHERLLPGANLVLWVPAFPLLYSRFDELLGHCRRYRLRELRALVVESGYSIVDVRYVNMIGWFSWLVVARLLGQVPTSARAVRLFDRWAVPIVRAVEGGIRAPFGQSLLIVAHKPLTTD
jgi:SAM-dependent methyltransferase